MAAYGALVSVMHIINQIQTHPHPPISMDPQQVEYLTHAVTLLQEFLESYSSHHGYTEEEDFWESRIAEAAYEAEDVIELYIVDQIRARSKIDVQHISAADFYQGLQKVIENMDLINIDIKKKMVVHIIKSVSSAAGSSRSTPVAQNVTMVGCKDILLRMLDKITGGGLDLQILPIVGMGGIGKTTLARNIYVSSLVKHHFDVRAWSTISQEYNAREILRQVLGQSEGDLSEHELGLCLYQYLIGRRYFVVMDDMWNIEAWDKVRRFFPDDRNGSRIVVTSRLSNLASQFNYSNVHHMKFLNKAASWKLFSKIVFEEETCPLELKDIGKKIVNGCRGLPLSVAVIGGLLSKSKWTKENWGFVEEHLASIVNLDDDESCLQVLYMSYNNLPVHLKSCFLYMGIYGEDEVILISSIIQFFVAEGFVKPICGKCLEETAVDYIEELVDRNLLIVEKRKHCGKLKSCKMHDLLRDVCLREARKLKFLCELGEHSIPQAINSQRRILSSLKEDEYPSPLLQSLESASLVRSFLGECPTSLSCNFRLSRVYCMGECFVKEDRYEEFFVGLVNLRFLLVHVGRRRILPRILSSVSFLWNLHTIYLFGIGHDYVFEIWKVPQLRHVMTYSGELNGAYCLSDPLSDEDDIVLENLQTLYTVSNLKFGEELLKEIPNIKKLKLYYGYTKEDKYHLNNLCCLHKLETLHLFCSGQDISHLVREVSFPYSIKKLTLQYTYLAWEDMKTKIGSLPHLQVLKLKSYSFIGSEWETSEDQFLNLKLLLIEGCDLECWITDNAHFPRLEHLVIRYIYRLREIPSCMGDIPTLQSIELLHCSDLVTDSAKIIREEQQELGNEDLQILV